MWPRLIGLYVVSRTGCPARLVQLDGAAVIAARPESVQIWLFSLFVAFAIKAPLVPFPHLAARRRSEAPIGAACCWSACSTGPTSGPALLPALFPARPGRWPLCCLSVVGSSTPRCSPSPERHERSSRTLDRALRLHLAGHLRLLHPGVRRLLYHGQTTHHDRVLFIVSLLIARATRGVSDYAGRS